MEEFNNILSRYDAVAKQAVNFDIDAQRWLTVFDLKCQIALALGADVQDVKDCLSVYDVDYLIYKTYGGELSKLDLISDYEVLIATIAIIDSGIDTSLIDSKYIAEMTLVNLLVPMQSGYFYLEPIRDNTEFTINSVDGAPVLNLEYSSDGKTWQNWDYTTNHITANANQRVYLRGQNEEWTTIENTSTGEDFNKLHYNSIISMSDAQFNIGGRLSSLFTGNEEETNKSIIMSAIFYKSSCRDASKLIVPKNAKLSYAFMGCSSLISAPRILSDSIIHVNQYNSMFDGCTSLTKAPKLPATTLTARCYYGLFSGCTSLSEAPQLPAMTIEESSYRAMFNNCKSLLKAPELPAMTIEESSYRVMFKGCSSLVKAPQLPATSLAPYCYSNMFVGCTSLVKAPELPATSALTHSYSFMFSGCTSLKEAPQLPAMSLGANSYYAMFANCKSLLKAPQLPAMTLMTNSYRAMFKGCSSLTSFNFGDQSIFANQANSLQEMFLGCKKLSYIRCLFDDRDGVGPREYTNWTSEVAPQGTFVTNTDKWKRGVNGIPSGWEVEIEGTSA